MVVFPNAKINLGLAVTHKREDGYHDLETLFVPIPGLHDILSINKSDKLEFCQSDGLDCRPEDNLVLKAYEAVRSRFPKKVKPCKICLTKLIPFGAGLGGGSADAAFTVVALNQLFRLRMTDEEMETLVAPLGADCPIFIQNRPRFARGTGNIFSEPKTADLQAVNGLYIVLVKPNCAVSTAAAYRGIVPRDQEPPRTRHQHWQNDFEKTVFPLFPEIAELKNNLKKHGAIFTSMSGSGATVFALFNDKKTASDIASNAMYADYFVHIEQLTL